MLLTVKDGEKKLVKIAQTEDEAQRGATARLCISTLKLSVPAVLDRADNRVNHLYAGWPDRLYVVGVDGKIAYQGGPGPGGFKIHEVDQWLKANVASSAK